MRLPPARSSSPQPLASGRHGVSSISGLAAMIDSATAQRRGRKASVRAARAGRSAGAAMPRSSQQRVEAGIEPGSCRRRRVLAQHLQAAGVGRGDHPEHGLAVMTGFDQLAAAVDRDRSGEIADVGGEKEWRADRGCGVEGVGQRGEMLLGPRSRHLRAAQETEQRFMEIEQAMLPRAEFSRREIAFAHRRF